MLFLYSALAAKLAGDCLAIKNRVRIEEILTAANTENTTQNRHCRIGRVWLKNQAKTPA